MEKLIKNASILIVDDTPKNIQLLGTVLKETGYRVIVATNGQSALNILEKTKPDLILLDVMMPELSGFETIQKIKENEEIKNIPVIFLTAKAEPDDVLEGFKLGAVDYITKPFHANELLARVKTHLELKINRDLIQNLLDFQKGLVLLIDETRILYANKSFLNYVEYPNLIQFNQNYSSYSDYFDILEENLEEQELKLKPKNKTLKNQIFLAHKTILPGKSVYILNLTDVTDYETEKTNLEQKASYDELTKIYNRTKFIEIFNEILKSVELEIKPLSLILFDIDHFKKINDGFGHNIGDKVLVEISSVVKSLIRNTDIFCRWGGEEFLILLNSSSIEDSFKIAEKIRTFIETKEFIPNHQVTISLGVSTFEKNDNLDSFINRADKALYQAKNSGRNKTEKS